MDVPEMSVTNAFDLDITHIILGIQVEGIN